MSTTATRLPYFIELFIEVAAAVRVQIDSLQDWGLSGAREGQYTIDVSADAVAVEMLVDAGFGVLSEESGSTHPERDVIVVVDPIDGSTNASAGLPWFGTSLCAVDGEGALAAVVVNQATGTTWTAIRGEGAWRDGVAIQPSGVTEISDAFITVSGLPTHHFGWRQFRCYGAAALDICSVADGTFDGFADLSVDAHGSWDYLGALLVLRESGGVIADVQGRELVVTAHDARRTPVAAATSPLLATLVSSAQEPPTSL